MSWRKKPDEDAGKKDIDSLCADDEVVEKHIVKHIIWWEAEYIHNFCTYLYV